MESDGQAARERRRRCERCGRQALSARMQTERINVNSICIQSKVHSAGSAAPGESVERGNSRDDRQPAANARNAAHRAQPQVRQRRRGAGRAFRRRERDGQPASEQRQRRALGRGRWREGKGRTIFGRIRAGARVAQTLTSMPSSLRPFLFPTSAVEDAHPLFSLLSPAF
jgi:hypothetical protein